ncbi:GNAT family N-acetyltransferase [Blastococcus sp. CT_GayMR20]|uniref:GNAT family N-acetyltransferase n=1 Tax=Blastococcus sp. CT_GayMR20 TaxID=2559609 RepID=UPI001072FC2B|nr:GNAT family N-acetyltransferase [Blastococcus sp. CT_GayMR20]TFV66003.1 GNAT family N-acetyltransferase [Blastococcus sp. CT_GayMR20]
MRVRRIATDDLAGIGWLDDGTHAGIEAAVAAGTERALVLVAVDDADAVVGVVAVDLPPWRGRTLPWLWLLDVRPERRGGVGTALLSGAHGQLAELGHRAVELSVDDANPRAAALYLRTGYVGVGRGADPGVGGPEPWTRMRLQLAMEPAQTRRNR